MRTWTTGKWVAGTPDEVLELLTEPDAIARWAPVPFEVQDLGGGRLRSGTRARVSGALAGRRMEFDVEIRHAHAGGLSLVATGPVSIDAEYQLEPAAGGSEVRAAVSVRGRGLLGAVIARAFETVLSAGALRASVARLGHQLEPAIAS